MKVLIGTMDINLELSGTEQARLMQAAHDTRYSSGTILQKMVERYAETFDKDIKDAIRELDAGMEKQ